MEVKRKEALNILRDGCVIPATPLVLKDDRTFDEKGQRLLMQYYLNAGVGGIATAVHSTQFEIRNRGIDLFEPIIRLVSREIETFEKKHQKTIFRICGVCGPVKQAVREAELALKYGYDAVLLSPGGLNDLSERELIERTKAVTEVLPVIGFYLQKAVGGRALSYQYWEKICEIKDVIAIKCAPFNRYETMDVVRAVANSSRCNDITLYTGNDDNLVVDLLTPYIIPAAGENREVRFRGGLLGQWCVGTRQAVKMFEEIRRIRNEELIPIDLLTKAVQITDINKAIFDADNGYKGCIPGIHEVLRRDGLYQNILCLDPLEVLSPGQADEITRVYQMYPQWSDKEFIKENIDRWRGEI